MEPARLQAAIDMLQEGKLLVASDIRKIIARGPPAAAFGTERWVGQEPAGDLDRHRDGVQEVSGREA